MNQLQLLALFRFTAAVDALYFGSHDALAAGAVPSVDRLLSPGFLLLFAFALYEGIEMYKRLIRHLKGRERLHPSEERRESHVNSAAAGRQTARAKQRSGPIVDSGKSMPPASTKEKPAKRTRPGPRPKSESRNA